MEIKTYSGEACGPVQENGGNAPVQKKERVSVLSKLEEAKQNSIREQLWLNYFNEVAYINGYLTEEQRNRIKLRIKSRANSYSR